MAPGRVLGQPGPDRVIDGELALGFELEQDHRGEGLGVAADLPQCAGRYGRPAVVAGGPVGQADGRPGAGEGDPQRDRGDVLGRAPGRQVIAEVSAQGRLQRGAGLAGLGGQSGGRSGGRAGGQKRTCAEQGAGGRGRGRGQPAAGTPACGVPDGRSHVSSSGLMRRWDRWY